MRNLASYRRDNKVAFVATLALLLQAVFMAWSVGAAPAAPALDAFGNPLCITGADGAAPAGFAGLGTPDCCAFGCSLSATTVPQAPDDGLFIIVAPAAVRAAVPTVLATPRPDPGRERPGPRAPPSTL